MLTSDAYALFQAITRMQNDTKPSPVKFGYALAVNSKRLKDISESFEASRADLIKQTAFLDDAGEPVVENQMYKLRDTDTFNAGMKALQDADIDVSLMKITIDEMPAELEPVMVTLFMPMIVEPA